MFGNTEYPLDGPGPLIAVSDPHGDFSTVILGYGQVEDIFRQKMNTNKDAQSM